MVNGCNKLMAYSILHYPRQIMSSARNHHSESTSPISDKLV